MRSSSLIMLSSRVIPAYGKILPSFVVYICLQFGVCGLPCVLFLQYVRRKLLLGFRSPFVSQPQHQLFTDLIYPAGRSQRRRSCSAILIWTPSLRSADRLDAHSSIRLPACSEPHSIIMNFVLGIIVSTDSVIPCSNAPGSVAGLSSFTS